MTDVLRHAFHANFGFVLFEEPSMPDVCSTDRTAIEALIERETAAYFAKDYATWAACWIHNEQALLQHMSAETGIGIVSGWSELSAMYTASMRDFPEPIPGAVTRVWGRFEASGDLAWVTFDQHAPPSDDPFEVSGVQHEIRVLQREADGWKLLCGCALRPASQVMRSPAIQVDAQAQVVWMNEAATAGLAGHPGLTISAGRLRGTNRVADKALEAAIRWAAKNFTYAQRHMALRDGRAVNGAVPVLLGGDPSAPGAACWVQAQDTTILVSFDNADVLDRRLRAAAGIFCLSPGQHQLARMIAEGKDLAQVATERAVSINTVRTQLQRTFDKVGVRNQAALLRVLLSVGPPAG